MRRGDPEQICAKLTINFKKIIKKMNVKILKNLLLYPGSPRRAFGAPRDDGHLGSLRLCRVVR